ncbi:MAG: nucleotidyltransferase family protein [Clostridia bacterium]|nr:nucleotidyltransferase family protein [Clostridia bacterium]
MRILGVIAEYNPFHSGHAHHLLEARKASGADYVVVAMSSCFTQRGEAAILSPADRARMALSCGADAVFALPACWAVRDAEHFALGGVALLHALGCSAISFGAETADLPALTACARMIEQPDEAFTAALQRHMSSGLPYPAALSAAMAECLPEAGAVLASPNNTLAVCYLRAMLRLNAQMDVYPIPRRADYHATGLTEAFPSATALRGAIHRGDWSSLTGRIPEPALSILCTAAMEGRLHRSHALDQALLYRLRTMQDAEWSSLPDLSEGIEDRLHAAARSTATRENLLLAAKTRRYPHARLSRLCTHALLGITQAQLEAEPLPTAAWLLGFRQAARPLLTQLKQNGFPIIGKAADYTTDEAWFRTELAAYDLWALGCGMPAGLGFTQGVVRI